MEKNTLYAIIFSTLFLVVWFVFFQQPKTNKNVIPAQVEQTQKSDQSNTALSVNLPKPAASQDTNVPEKEIVVDTKNYKVIFTNRGAAVKHWFLKEKNGTLTDLVLKENSEMLSTLPGSNYTVSQPEPLKVVFTHTSTLGWEIVKTYELSDNYLHTLKIETKKNKDTASLPSIQLGWGPGLGTDAKEQKENESLTRAIGFTASQPQKLEKFKPGEYAAQGYKWIALDNRYFLAAIIPQQNLFKNVSVARLDKKHPLDLSLSANAPGDVKFQELSMQIYLGPKGHNDLKALKLNLEESVDFGFFGFLGKIALYVLHLFYKYTGNYGWAIILLTFCIQILVLPLTIKSFKASAAMKELQPLIKQLQEKYKSDPKRLNMEMLNLYKTQKVNPLGGCLPMILQLPIFWALFATLRNAFELRGASWILWVKDLSAPDTLLHIGGIPLNVLPLIMGIGMFFQQKMMSVTTDPAQAKMMYLMPIIFTFMFWSFPSGLVIYWLTNSILTMIEQYFVLHRPKPEVA